MPVLSIIVPVYNKEPYIDAGIQSVLNQTFTDFELILINDGSTDGSAAICQRYQEIDNRVKLINKANGGVSSARNRGLQEAIGQYIGFLDSDDTIEPDMYELLINNIKQFDADISACRLRTVFSHKEVTPAEQPGPISYTRQQAISTFLKGDMDYSANTRIYKAHLAKQVEFTGRIFEDILYQSKVFIKANTTVFESVVKYNYLVRENSVSVSEFNPRYFETIQVSGNVLDMVKEHCPGSLPQAQAFDAMTNLSLLNLLLLSGKETYPSQYNQVINRLKQYSSFISTNAAVRNKHRYAYRIFTLSPWFYTKAIYWYSIITGAEITKRAKKQPATSQAAATTL